MTSCTLRTLPDPEISARLARRENPVNAPSLVGGAAALALSPQHLALLTSNYWGARRRTLYVRFMERTSRELASRILAHMNAWYAGGVGIRFSRARTGMHSDVRITRTQDGYWSYLGTDIGGLDQGAPTMCLQDFSMDTPESEYRRVVRHETGHTLGFPHEHMRAELVALIDPEKAYRYFYRTQGWTRREVAAQVLTPLEQDRILPAPGPPDQNSIMCYQLPGSITKSGAPITGGVDIDPSDQAFANSVYPR